MRIQNNITAMNTHRMYTINNDNVAKSAEKLSSGYRINRAGDDAAGLAISEKMRAQIRGLNMATKNSQDAISLVQTAEGALQETHSMLQRMNELAVQAATGTNEGFDRTQAAKEFEQLKREINDVAEQTNFNNMKILDGSLSYEGYVRSAETAGVNMTVATDSSVSNAAIKIDNKAAVAGTPGAKAAGLLDLSTGAFKIGAATVTSGTALSPADDYKLTLKVNGKEVELKTADGKDASIKTGATADAIDNMFAGAQFEVDGKVYELIDDGTAKDGKLEIIAKDPGKVDISGWSIDVSVTQVKAGTHEVIPVGANNDGVVYTATNKTLDTPTSTASQQGATNAAASVVSGVDKVQGSNVVTKLELDPAKIQDGDSLSIGGKTYTFYTKKGTDATGDYGLDANGNKVYTAASGSGSNIIWNGSTGIDSNVASKLEDAMNDTAANGGIKNTTAAAAGAPKVTVDRDGNTITVTAEPLSKGASTADKPDEVATNYKDDVTEAQSVSEKFAAEFKTSTPDASGRKTTVEFDVAKMKDGDKFTIKAGNKNIEVTFNGESRADFMKKVDTAVKTAEAGSFAKVKGNALIVDDKEVTTSLAWNEKLNEKTNAIRIQVGANENEQLALSIDSMNTAGLHLDDAHLTVVGQSTDENIDSAGAAITAVKAAINKVSDQRATLGAMQNRLDHKIANLKVSSENLSAAESRIRDVDMASEMTNFTKNNILSQAATAMLAQANALPQNVLSLLG